MEKEPEQLSGLAKPVYARSGLVVEGGLSESRAAYVCIDVSKATLDVGLRPSAQVECLNDEKGIGRLLRRLGELSPTLVVLEASGGLELALVASLGAAEPAAN